MNWKVKALLTRLLGCTPRGGEIINYYRTHLGKGAQFDIKMRLGSGQRLLTRLRKEQVEIANTQILEIGSGWHPILPLLLYLSGARRIVMTDYQPWMSPATVRATWEQFQARLPEVSAIAGVSEAQAREKLAKLQPVDDHWREHWARAGLEYHAPLNLATQDPPTGPFDIIFSNSVFQLINERILRQIVLRTPRWLAPGGICYHDISPGDTFAIDDRRLSVANHLQFSRWAWSFLGQGTLGFHNRLRPSDYSKLFVEAGLAVGPWEIATDPRSLQNLPKLRIHPDFQAYPPEELAAREARVVLRAGREPDSGVKRDMARAQTTA